MGQRVNSHFGEERNEDWNIRQKQTRQENERERNQLRTDIKTYIVDLHNVHLILSVPVMKKRKMQI